MGNFLLHVEMFLNPDLTFNFYNSDMEVELNLFSL